MSEIITEPEQATTEWLSAVLGSNITAITGHERIGTGQMSRNFRLDLEGDGPDSIVLKVPAAEDGVRELGAQAYQREVAFYRDVATGVKCHLPACHYHEISETGQEFTLVLQDMAPAEQGDQLGGCSVDQAALALRNLAGAQGPGWNDDALKSVPIFAPSDASIIRDFYPIAHQQFLDRYGDRLMDHTAELLSAFSPVALEWIENQPGPVGIVHGDYRLDNLLFTDDAVAAVDWQTVALGPPARDVAYFLGNSLTIEDRQQHETDLLQVYLDELNTYGVTDYNMDQLLEDYARGAWQGPFITVLGAFTATQTDRGDEMFIAMADRSTSQAADHNSVRFL